MRYLRAKRVVLHSTRSIGCCIHAGKPTITKLFKNFSASKVEKHFFFFYLTNNSHKVHRNSCYDSTSCSETCLFVVIFPKMTHSLRSTSWHSCWQICTTINFSCYRAVGSWKTSSIATSPTGVNGPSHHAAALALMQSSNTIILPSYWYTRLFQRKFPTIYI